METYNDEKHIQIHYRQTSDISRAKSQKNFNISRLVLQLPLCNVLKPSVKSRIKI